MKQLTQHTRKGEQGFTLVELAIVMIIIGLLIGGVLKGQELIANAQVSATLTQAKSFEAAINTFQDSYSAFPGDMQGADTRLPNCTDCGSGDGNTRLSADPTGAAADDERAYFWQHLAAGDLISGSSVDGAVDAASFDVGGLYPQASIGGGFTVGYTDDGMLGNGDGQGGTYVLLANTPGGEDDPILTHTQAARIDRKADDGVADTGNVLSGNGDCAAYDETLNEVECTMFIRVR